MQMKVQVDGVCLIYNSNCNSNGDIITEIVAVRDELAVSFRCKHVHIHHPIGENSPAPLEIQLNEDCDEHAKKVMRRASTEWQSLPSAISPPSVADSLTISTPLVTKKYPPGRIR